jgi:uncharacterized protein (TIGR02444 family)
VPEESGSLWRHCLVLYARPGVAARCLELQERCGADINLLLTAGWLASRGLRWRLRDVAALQALSAEWRERCLLPLRSVRRYARERVGEGLLYNRLKEAELEAERHQLRLIEDWLLMNPPPASAAEDLVHRNLAQYLRRQLGVLSAADVAQLAALLEAGSLAK